MFKFISLLITNGIVDFADRVAINSMNDTMLNKKILDRFQGNSSVKMGTRNWIEAMKCPFDN